MFMRKSNKRTKILLAFVVVIIITIGLYAVISGYIKNSPKYEYAFSKNTKENFVAYPNVQFAVISDLHYYDTSLGTTGKAFEECMLSDRKLLKESAELLDLAIDNILKSDAEFVLIPGDLTKDAETINHQKVASSLSRLEDEGIKVFVVPGNHDVNNDYGAVKFEGDKTVPIENVSAEQFAEIYSEFGYENAISRDENSLSYLAKLNENLWLIALDSCRFEENVPDEEEIVSGKFVEGQVKWLENVLQMANDEKKAVIVMEHHGLVEHWTGQSKLHEEYLVEDYQYISKLLASYGVRLSFTGHYHAQDITLADYGENGFIYDIQTGSLITAPCALRYCSIANNQLEIQSNFLIGLLRDDKDFEKNAMDFVADTIKREGYKVLKGYFVSDKDADIIADYVTAAFMAHYSGDEDPSNMPSFDKSKLGFWSRFIYSQQKYIIEGLWNDLPPCDNNLIIDLN